MEKPIISFNNFSFQYLSQAEPTLKQIELEIKAGEKILIAGPSGSGKSTLAKCLNGLIPNEDRGELTGKCLINGKDITTTDIFELSFTTSTILQDTNSQFVGLTVAEDIAFALENDALPKNEMQVQVAKWAKELNLTELLTHSPQKLSGGQKQRVSLAGVLVDGSPILLFDEPLANLDPVASLQTMELIDKLQSKTKATVIIIEHRLEDVLACQPDRIIVMANGQIVADQTPTELFKTALLPQVGLRRPLFLEALIKAGIDVTNFPDLTNVSALPDDLQIKKALAKSYLSPKTSEKSPSVPLLKVKDLSFSYEVNSPLLQQISFTLNKGDFVSLVGQNGAGKTTLIKLICGFLNGTGSITLDQTDLSKTSIKERAEQIGYIMQDPNQMISQKMIFDEVALGLRLRGADEQSVREKVMQVLKVCGLYAYRNWPITALSYGQKKRVTIASILVLEPQILILDEPTAGQDYRTYTEIMQFLRYLNRKKNCTIVIVTHDMHLMLEYTTRSLVLSHGRLLADLHPSELLARPKLLEKASLRQTSLYQLAKKYDLSAKAMLASLYHEET